MANNTATPPEKASDAEEVVDAQVVDDDEPGAELEPSAKAPPPAASSGSMAVATLWNTHDPEAIVERAAKVATALDKVIKAQGMATSMGGNRQHVNVEAWQTAGTLLGLQAIIVDTRRIEPRSKFTVKAKRKKWGKVDGKRAVVEETDHEWTVEGWSYEAIAEVRTMDGRVVGRAETTCSREESKWFDSDEYAVKSMAQTRAVSRALRQALGFIVGMAGYSTTPAEEMTGEEAPAQPAPAEASGPAYGPPAAKEDEPKIGRAMAFLLQHDGAPDMDAGLEVIDKVIKRADGYFPEIVGKAIGLTAAKLRELDPELADNAPEPDDQAARAEADAAQAAAEGGDAAPSDPPQEATKPAGQRDADEIPY